MCVCVCVSVCLCVCVCVCVCTHPMFPTPFIFTALLCTPLIPTSTI